MTTVTKGATTMTATPDAPELRQAAIDAAGRYLDVTTADVEHAMEVAFDTIAEGLYIADDRHGIPGVWTSDGERVAVRIGEGPSERLWALLAAVIPTREVPE